jgi:hypothetical protein
MNIYLLTQDINNDYDTYDSVVVSAESEEDARLMHPSGDDKCWGCEGSEWRGTWVRTDERHLIQVKLIGNSGVDKGVILASFNAG